MTWKIFCDINKEIFSLAPGSWKTTFWKLGASAAGLAALIGAYWKILDGIVHWLIQALVPAANVDATIKVWDGSPHYVSRTLIAFFALAIVYAVAFALTAQERLDYRYRLAQTLGVRFLSMKREHDVLDLNGRCQTISTERLEVYDLALSYIERRLQVLSATSRSLPDIQVEGLPDGIVCNRSRRDEGLLRVYVLNFVPPLRRTESPVKVTISEEIDQAIFMYDAVTPVHPVLQSQVESISLFVLEPLDRLELSVTFPPKYAVGGQSQVSVRYGRTSTVHNAEEDRLRKEGAVSARVENGRQTLSLTVQEPVLGLHYYLYWIPPSKPGSGTIPNVTA